MAGPNHVLSEFNWVDLYKLKNISNPCLSFNLSTGRTSRRSVTTRAATIRTTRSCTSSRRNSWPKVKLSCHRRRFDRWRHSHRYWNKFRHLNWDLTSSTLTTRQVPIKSIWLFKEFFHFSLLSEVMLLSCIISICSEHTSFKAKNLKTEKNIVW